MVEIDNYGERLIGCIECNRWTSRGSKQPIELPMDDLEALKLAAQFESNKPLFDALDDAQKIVTRRAA